MKQTWNLTQGLTLRQAALIAGFGYLLSPVGYAESNYPKLVIAGNIEQTIENIAVHRGKVRRHNHVLPHLLR